MDISTIAQRCLRLLSIVERHPAEPTSLDLSVATSKWHAMLEALGDPQVIIFGRIARQKRIRKYVAMITAPTATHLMAYKEIMFRWSSMTARVDIPIGKETGHMSPVSQDDLHEWQNYMCFLASAGRCFQIGDVVPFPPFLTPLLPLHLHAPAQPSDMAKQFITEVMQQLTSDNLPLLEAAKEALGTELHPKLLPMLFEILNE